MDDGEFFLETNPNKSHGPHIKKEQTKNKKKDLLLFSLRYATAEL